MNGSVNNTDLRRRARSAITACGAPPGARGCLCARWLASGQQVICEGEDPVEGPPAISVTVEGG